MLHRFIVLAIDLAAVGTFLSTGREYGTYGHYGELRFAQTTSEQGMYLPVCMYVCTSTVVEYVVHFYVDMYVLTYCNILQYLLVHTYV